MKFQVGDMVDYHPELKRQGYYLRCGSGTYPCAVVASVDPFILISMEGDMRWSREDHEQFEVVGWAGKEMMKVVMDRLYRDYPNMRPTMGQKLKKFFAGITR